MAEAGTGRVPWWQDAPRHILGEQITQGPLTARRNEAVLLDIFPTTAKGREPRLSQVGDALGLHSSQWFRGDGRAEPEENPRPLMPPLLLREGAGVRWEVTVGLQVPPVTPRFPCALSLPRENASAAGWVGMGETHGLRCPLPGPFLPLILLQPQPHPSAVKTNGMTLPWIECRLDLILHPATQRVIFFLSSQTSLTFCHSPFSFLSLTAFLGGGFFF